MKRRLLAIFLSLTMIFTLVPTAWALSEEGNQTPTPMETSENGGGAEGSGSVAREMNGNCGATEADHVTWELTDADGDGFYTLTISGNGAMADYYAQYVQRATEFEGDIAPWRRALLLNTSADRTTDEVVPITEVVIGDGVTRIGSGAFAYTELTGTVTFNENVTSYGDGVFARDTSITAVDWTNFKPTEKIRDGWATAYTEEHIAVPYAFFDGCSSLGTSILDDITYSGQLVLPDTIEAIYVAAFRGTGFSTVDFSDGLSSIQAVGSYAITKLANMTEFTYPGNVDFYGVNDEGQNNVIQGGGIQKLTIAKEVTKLPVSFCTNTENLTVIEFESGSQLTEIGKTAFYNTQALKSIDIPSTVTSIGESAFADCFSLEKIELGQIESFGPNTFARCSSLETAKIQGSSGVTYPSNMFGTWGTGHSAAPLKTLEIGAGKIQFSLNRQKDSIEAIVLGDGVTEIPANFAADCTKLTSVSLPDALTSVPASAFKGCSSLEKVDISENSELQSIGSNAFQNSALTQIYIPKNVTSIGSGAFNRTPTTVFDMSDVLAESMTVGDYAINNWYDSSKPEEYPEWKDNFKCIYVSNSGAAASVKEKTSNCKYAFFVTNGGSVDATKTGFAAVYRAGYTAQWYETENFTGSPVTEDPVTGKTYYAKWTKSDSVALTSNPVPDKDGNVSATYDPDGAVTLSVQNPGAGWLYSWMKNGEQISAAGNSLTLYTPSDSGKYSVQVTTKGNNALIWTSNAINVTIAKAVGTASVSMDGWAYGEAAKKPVPASATNGTENVTYQYKVKDANDSTYSNEVPTAAGSYTVKATFPETVNYKAVTATADFTITKAAYNMTGVEFENASYTYDGSEKTLTISGTLPTGVTVAYENNKLTNAGSVTATAKFTIADSNNYCAIDDMTATLTITKAKPTVSISAKPDSLRGGGKVTLTVTGVPEEGKVIVTCDNGITVDNVNGTYSAVLPNRTVDYTFTLNYTGVENGNYSDATDTCTVSVTRRHTSSVTPGNTVSVPSTPNGTVTVSPSTASKGETVTITTKPSEGYELGSIEVLDKNGDSLKLKDLGNGKYSFVMPDGKVSVEAEFVKTAATSFVDVPANAYFADAVKWAVDKGITNGLSDTMFGPYEPCTRAQIVTFLWRAAGSPEPKTASSFTDVPANAYYAKAVAWAVENGITNGMTATEFAPDATCTRGQSVTFLYRALKGSAGATSSFVDVPTNAFYADAVGWAVSGKVTDGTSNTTFSPDDNCTRGQIVTFLYRAYQGK